MMYFFLRPAYYSSRLSNDFQGLGLLPTTEQGFLTPVYHLWRYLTVADLLGLYYTQVHVGVP